MFRAFLELEHASIGVGDVFEGSLGGGRREICLVGRLSGASGLCFSHICYGEVEGILGVGKGKAPAIVALGD